MYNINPVLWGEHMWKSLHYITLSYPDDPSENIKILFRDFFVNIIWKYLPCEKCRHNYVKHLEELPLTDDILSSRDKFIYWLVDIHNIVNEETGKKKISYDTFNDIYMGNGNNTKTKYMSLYIVIISVLVLMLLFVIYKKL